MEEQKQDVMILPNSEFMTVSDLAEMLIPIPGLNRYIKLSDVAKELRRRSMEHITNVVVPLPKLSNRDGVWSLDGQIVDGKIYEIAFAGSDADAEVIERHTGLTFLGEATEAYESEKSCHMTRKMTKRRVILAKTY